MGRRAEVEGHAPGGGQSSPKLESIVKALEICYNRFVNLDVVLGEDSVPWASTMLAQEQRKEDTT